MHLDMLEDMADELTQEYRRRVRLMAESNRRGEHEDVAAAVNAAALREFRAIRSSEAAASAAPAAEQKTAALPAQWVQFDEQLEFWEGARRFSQIGATFSALLAVGVDGRLYAWRWGEKPSERRLAINATWFKGFFCPLFPLLISRLFAEDKKEKIVELVTCSWRAVVRTDRQRVASFLDEHCGPSACRHSATPLLSLPSGATVQKLVVCRSHAAVLTDDQRLFWW